MSKKLYRSKEKLLGGVLAGLADYFEQDVVAWRLGAIVLLILTGLMPGTLIYVIAWVVIPEEPLISPLSEEDYTVTS